MKAAGGLRSAGTFPSVKPYSKPFNRNIMKQKKIRRQPQKKPSPRQQKPRKREDGRPQGTLKRFPFDETRKAKFRRYLDEYRRDGVYCRRGKRLTPERKAYYEGICRRKREEYIRRNRRRLLAEARNAPGGDRLLGEIKSILKMKR